MYYLSATSIKITTMPHIIRQIVVIHTSSSAIVKGITSNAIASINGGIRFCPISNPSFLFEINGNREVA